MKKSLLAICFAAISATSVSAIANNAGSGTITFKGTINSGACTIAPMDLNKEVSLGNINADNLKVSGNTGPQSNFELKLNDCKLDTGEPDEQYSKVEITFSGKADNTDASLWANSGSASNVAVAFFDSNGDAIKPGTKLEQVLKSPDTSVLLSAKAQATGQATSGDITAVANYVLSYQ
ncbi:fimbrial protein [Proteus myxofaciens]|uniref:PapA family protein n=1 Tax=Proteus myxofaciens ATCC 19692 TaxID=1354337 RepID=A0A198FJ72_9GAMM|nr:fimbrial protein [Proteus myxofaciens]OAT24928.1 PapA family protein [Proteus myxofaciens ATCC 19692]